MNEKNVERRWIESEAQLESRKPRRSCQASSNDDPSEEAATPARDVRNRGIPTSAAVEDDAVGGSVNVAATERFKEDLVDDADDDENDASGWTDLFADPDPMDEFQFRFELPIGEPLDGERSGPPDEASTRRIDIRLVGYKAELGQTLHSTGLTLWRASSLLCDFLLQHPEHVRGKSVVELGAGLGLCGILASHLQASKVVLTDGDSDALKYLRANVERNVPRPQHQADEDDSIDAKQTTTPVIVRQLIWGDAAAFPRSDSDTFDTVLGSDIVYVEEILEPLWRTVDDLMSPEGVFLLAFARRNVPVDRVFDAAAAHGFAWTCDDSNCEGVIVFRRAGSGCER